MAVEISDAEKKEIKENNATRLRRAKMWMYRAKSATKYPPAKSLDGPAVQFIFWWIAFEALYSKEPKNNTSMENFIKNATKADEVKISKKVNSCKRKGAIRKLVTLLPTHTGFWQQPDKKIEYDEWMKKFEEENKKCEYGKPNEILMIVFKRLRVVRNQIFHGANSRHRSYGISQVEHGVELLIAFVPCFIEIVKTSADQNPPRDWGKVPFPRQGVRNQKDLKPVWVKQEK